MTDLLLKPPGQRPGAPDRRETADAAVLSQWMGVAFAEDRIHHNLTTYRSILGEISKLRELDLSSLHPAVIFDPARGFKERNE